jgi:hypothetical protein
MLKWLPALVIVLLGFAFVVARQDQYAAGNCPRWYVLFLYSLFRWPNGTGAWALILTLLAIADQSEQTKKAAEAARDSAEAQMDADRAWILVSVHGQPNAPLTKQIRDGIAPSVELQVEVAGHTPARIISEKYRCHIVPATPSGPELDPTPTYPPGVESIKDPVVLAPGNKSPRNVRLESSSQTMELAASVTEGRSIWCAYGRIEYEDAFKREGITQFCAIFYPVGRLVESIDGRVFDPGVFHIGGPKGYNGNT